MENMPNIELAITGLLGVKEILEPLLLKLNYEGLGEDDVKELKEHLKLAIEALKKQEIRKIVIVKVPKKWGGQVAKCPNCGEILTVSWLHCHYCGQKLDWEV